MQLGLVVGGDVTPVGGVGWREGLALHLPGAFDASAGDADGLSAQAGVELIHRSEQAGSAGTIGGVKEVRRQGCLGEEFRELHTRFGITPVGEKNRLQTLKRGAHDFAHIGGGNGEALAGELTVIAQAMLVRFEEGFNDATKLVLAVQLFGGALSIGDDGLLDLIQRGQRAGE